MVKHILLIMLLLPMTTMAQKHDSIIIKVPFYDAKLPTTDSTNVLWTDSTAFRSGTVLEFENPDITIASFAIIYSTKGEMLRMGGLSNKLPYSADWFIERVTATKATVTLHIEKIYLKGNLRTANWTYRVRVR